MFRFLVHLADLLATNGKVLEISSVFDVDRTSCQCRNSWAHSKFCMSFDNLTWTSPINSTSTLTGIISLSLFPWEVPQRSSRNFSTASLSFSAPTSFMHSLFYSLFNTPSSPQPYKYFFISLLLSELPKQASGHWCNLTARACFLILRSFSICIML